MIMTQYLTTIEAARLLGVSERRVRVFCTEGRLGVKIGRNYVITASGGVQITSWEVAENIVVDDQVKETHGKGVPPDSAPATFPSSSSRP